MKRILAAFALLVLCMAVPTRVAAQKNHSFQVMKNLDIFNNMYVALDTYYVDSLDADRLVKTGIDAILRSLDPYTEYYAEEDEGDLKMLTQAKYGGIGSLIRMMKDSTVIIAEPYAGMPAAEVGLQAGDVLLKIDKNDLKGKTTSEVSDLLRGEPGSTFVLKYHRPGEDKSREVKITRKNIKLLAVPYYGMVRGHGYINLNQFTSDCYDDVRKAFVSLKQQGAKDLILDLRVNPGGALDQAVKIVNLFVPKGVTIVETRGKVKTGNATYKTTDNPLDTDIPLVVLVSNSSASASEIVTGSIQDLDRGVVVGARTFGKGLVQSIRDLPYNGNLKLTTAKYYIPSGRCIQEIDYKRKRQEGTGKSDSTAVADSVFHTAGGRLVYSGKGIAPDVEVHHDTMPNIVLYLSNDDVLMNYCVKYAQTHSAPTSADDFTFTDEDFADFKRMVLESGFTYDRLSDKRLQDLKKVAQFEGYYEDAKAEFDALEAKLKHNLSAELDRHEESLRPLVICELIKHYFFQAGSIQESLKDDPDVAKAAEILEDKVEYDRILKGQKGQ